MINEKRVILKTHLSDTLDLLENSLNALSYSYDKCRNIRVKSEYDLEEQESFEALTSRFARTSDILTQKAFKTLFIILQEDIKTIIDAANLSEKIGISQKAEDVLNIRELRNQIAHDYIHADLAALFTDVLQHVPKLKMLIISLKEYVERELEKIPD